MADEKDILTTVPLSGFMMQVSPIEITLIVGSNNVELDNAKAHSFKLVPEWHASYSMNISVAQQLVQALTGAIAGWEQLTNSKAPTVPQLQQEAIKAPTVGR